GGARAAYGGVARAGRPGYRTECVLRSGLRAGRRKAAWRRSIRRAGLDDRSQPAPCRSLFPARRAASLCSTASGSGGLDASLRAARDAARASRSGRTGPRSLARLHRARAESAGLVTHAALQRRGAVRRGLCRRARPAWRCSQIVRPPPARLVRTRRPSPALFRAYHAGPAAARPAPSMAPPRATRPVDPGRTFQEFGIAAWLRKFSVAGIERLEGACRYRRGVPRRRARFHARGGDRPWPAGPSVGLRTAARCKAHRLGCRVKERRYRLDLEDRLRRGLFGIFAGGIADAGADQVAGRRHSHSPRRFLRGPHAYDDQSFMG